MKFYYVLYIVSLATAVGLVLTKSYGGFVLLNSAKLALSEAKEAVSCSVLSCKGWLVLPTDLQVFLKSFWQLGLLFLGMQWFLYCRSD